MYIVCGKCGHLKAKRDNHPSCISCTACLRVSPCSICSKWTNKVWSLTVKRRLYSIRKWVMTQKRKQKKSKKTKSQSDLSDNGTHDGSTAPLSYTAWGRTHQGGSPGDLVSDRALSPPVTSHRSSSHRSTNHRSASHQSTIHGSTNHWSASHQSTSHRARNHQSYSHQSSTHRSTSHRSTTHQSSSHQSTRH